MGKPPGSQAKALLASLDCRDTTRLAENTWLLGLRRRPYFPNSGGGIWLLSMGGNHLAPESSISLSRYRTEFILLYSRHTNGVKETRAGDFSRTT